MPLGHAAFNDLEVEGWIGSYRAIADGLLDEVTGDVERLTGHPPIGLEDVLRRG
jgi:NAD(P)H dehydrogenase (quinone)